MSILQAIYQLLFGPLELFFEVIYGVAFHIVDGNAGAAVIPLSLCLNFLLLPLYNRADAIQRAEHERDQQMAPGVEHINKVFKGDERYMMLQTYYRVHAYKPIYALRSSLPLLLEIPFFVAAYHFLSNLADFHNTPFGPLANLAAPDGLLKLGSISLNLLPILMTAVNIVSSRIYAKDLSRKDKLQLYGMALIFLVLLYNSPSGLVFYWTLNNVFSLFKNIVNTSKNREAVAGTLMSGLGLAFLAYFLLVNRRLSFGGLAVLLLGVLFQLPMLRYLIRRRKGGRPLSRIAEPKEKASSLFALGCLFLAVLTGLLIPTSVIHASPAEFVVLTEYRSPLQYVWSAFLLAAGTFLLWFMLFHYLAGHQAGHVMEAGICIASVLAVVDYMFFGTKLGNLSAMLQYDIAFHYSWKECLLNLAVLTLCGAAVLLLWRKKKKFLQSVFPVLILAVAGMSVYNIAGIRSELPQIRKLAERETGEKASFPLSRNGKNVIVFMLDRGISSYVPYLFQEKPELKQQFDGFTWYPNTLSFGCTTNTGSPALFGGYEYTPEELNKRSSEALAAKHNEALKLLPVLFGEAGYEVTVCHPPYAGYTEIPDLSIFEDCKGVHAYNTENGQFRDQGDLLADRQKIWNRNFFCYSIMKISPLVLQSGLYQGGQYFNSRDLDSMLRHTQFVSDRSLSHGIDESFMNAYSVLCALPEISTITEDSRNTYLALNNGTAHDVMLLKEPEYEPALYVDNTAYDAEHEDRFTLDGRTMLADIPYTMKHYQCNMAAFLQLGNWFDFLREQGVYDNTRIILVADHGHGMAQFEDMIFGDWVSGTWHHPQDVMSYNPLLMVKDFDSRGFRSDGRFMTNADTPVLALDGLVDEPVNPFTGNPISDAAKAAEEHRVFYTDISDPWDNDGNTFLPDRWYALKGQDIFDLSAWSSLGIF